MTTPNAEDFATLLAATRNEPALYFRHVLEIELRRWQEDILEEIAVHLRAGEKHVRVVARTAHGAGKTTLAAGLGLWFTTTRQFCRGISTAPTWAAVESLLWVEIAKLYGGSLLSRAGLGRLLSTSLELAPGWDLVGVASDRPQNLEGRHSTVAAVRIVDEAKAVEPGVFEATEGLLDAPETLDVWISTPSLPSGPFFNRDIKGGADVIRAVVTIDDLIDEGLPGKVEWKQRRLEEWGENSAEYQSRALARYIDDAEGSLYPFGWIERAMDAGFDVDMPPIAGLDVAGSVAGDATALSLLAGPDAEGRYRLQRIESWHERDTQTTKGRALALVRNAGATRLRIDCVGIGQGVADSIARDFGGVERFRASDKPNDATRFTNRKAEVAWHLRGLLEAGLIRLPKHAGLKAELVAERYEINAQGRTRVVDPSDSPDLLDSLLIALAGRAKAANGAWLELMRLHESATAHSTSAPSEAIVDPEPVSGAWLVGPEAPYGRDRVGGEPLTADGGLGFPTEADRKSPPPEVVALWAEKHDGARPVSWGGVSRETPQDMLRRDLAFSARQSAIDFQARAAYRASRGGR